MTMITTSFISDTINLADYFFIGSDFNWKNIELTSEKRGNKFPGEEDLHLLSGAHPADEDDSQFWIEL
jgi:hypothetical protein